MVTFGDIYPHKREAFYGSVDIGRCSLYDWDGELLHNGERPCSVPMTTRDPTSIHWNNYGSRWYGQCGENWLFINTCAEVLYDESNVDSSDEDNGSSTWVGAREGFLVKVNIQDEMGYLLEVPVRFRLLQYVNNCRYGEGAYGTTHTVFPLFETEKIKDNTNVQPLLDGLSKVGWRGHRIPFLFNTTGSFNCMSDIPICLQKFYLTKDKKRWWSANKIASAWTRTYWDPTTYIGKKRLQRKFEE